MKNKLKIKRLNQKLFHVYFVQPGVQNSPNFRMVRQQLSGIHICVMDNVYVYVKRATLDYMPMYNV